MNSQTRRERMKQSKSVHFFFLYVLCNGLTCKPIRTQPFSLTNEHKRALKQFRSFSCSPDVGISFRPTREAKFRNFSSPLPIPDSSCIQPNCSFGDKVFNEFSVLYPFLVACMQLYNLLRLSVRPSVYNNI